MRSYLYFKACDLYSYSLGEALDGSCGYVGNKLYGIYAVAYFL